MSKLLDDIIEERRQQALDYEAYLAKILDAAKTLGTKEPLTDYPWLARYRSETRAV